MVPRGKGRAVCACVAVGCSTRGCVCALLAGTAVSTDTQHTRTRRGSQHTSHDGAYTANARARSSPHTPCSMEGLRWARSAPHAATRSRPQRLRALAYASTAHLPAHLTLHRNVCVCLVPSFVHCSPPSFLCCGWRVAARPCGPVWYGCEPGCGHGRGVAWPPCIAPHRIAPHRIASHRTTRPHHATTPRDRTARPRCDRATRARW